MTAKSSRWDAYIDAVLRIEAPGGVVWVRPAPVSWSSGEYPEPEGRAICVITAHNPGGRLASEAENASAQARLAAELERRGLTWWPAAGGDPSWRHVESSAAVIGMAEADAIALGAQFGQDAIFVLTRAERLVVGCAEERIVATGWAVEPEADRDAVTSGPAAAGEKIAAGHHEKPEELGTWEADEDQDDTESRDGPEPAVPVSARREPGTYLEPDDPQLAALDDLDPDDESTVVWVKDGRLIIGEDGEEDDVG
jgi:hypothetical protein